MRLPRLSAAVAALAIVCAVAAQSTATESASESVFSLEAVATAAPGGQDKVERALALLTTLPAAEHAPATAVATTTGFVWRVVMQILHLSEPSLEHFDYADAAEAVSSAAAAGSPLDDAVELLEAAAAQDNADALYVLGDLHFYGNYTHRHDYPAALGYYKRLADLTGNATAQSTIGFMYATGMFGTIERDQAKALLYHTFAALGGSTRSDMTLAFRYHSGIGTPRNCDQAALFYKRVADKAMAHWRSGPHGGRTLDRYNWKLAEDHGGVFGEGASESSSGPNSRKRYSPASDSASLDDVLEYLRYIAKKSDIAAQYSLARLYYDGTRSLPRSYTQALHYFKSVAKHYWTNDAAVIPGASKTTELYAGKAAGYLGRMCLRGEGTPQDYALALQWFKLGFELGDPASQNGYGYMLLKGLGVKQNVARAAECFRGAADVDYGPAQVNIGKLYLEQGDMPVAIHYFELASRYGNVEAFYYLAETHNQGLGRERSCGMATAYYKIVAERVEEIQSPLQWAHRMYEQGDVENALIGFMMAAEQGYESGQANTAYLLDRDKSMLDLTKVADWYRRLRHGRRRGVDDQTRWTDELALIYWTRSSKQANVDSTVKMGDYYLKGIGADRDHDKAALCYQAAAEYQQSALALWNLGWMHENGLGVEQDFHLAKRFYDLALATNAEAYLPVTLSLYRLRVRSFWNSISGGSVNGILHEQETPEPWSLSEFWHKWFVEPDDEYRPYPAAPTDRVDGQTQFAPAEPEFEDDGEAMHIPPGPGEEYYEYDDFDEDLTEMLLIFGLCGAVAVLFWFRQQRAHTHERQRRERLMHEELRRREQEEVLRRREEALAQREEQERVRLRQQAGQPAPPAPPAAAPPPD
ncbi:uncharacterized protein V1510DRAFT_374548, partial [Dipodascopsis tothii]|uniref:uncharacterized protein n=1 Tax=Dipodascopsis tothii TaxID=44089 RepID=UPI0034CE0824